MKTIKELQAEIAKHSEQIKECEEASRDAQKRWLEIYETMTIEEKKAHAKAQAKDALMSFAYAKRDEAKRAGMLRAIAQHNLAAVAEREAIAALRQVLPAFKGKQAGDKTRGKISDEIMKLAGVRCWLGAPSYDGSREYVTIYAAGMYSGRGVDVYPSTAEGYRFAIISKSNTINDIASADFERHLCDYIDDPEARIKAFEKARAKTAIAEKAYKDAKSEQTRLSVQGFDL